MVRFDFEPFELRLAGTWRLARTRGAKTASVVLAKLTDPEGVIGLGEAAPVARYGESPDTVATFLQKLNPARLSFNDLAGSTRYLDLLSPGDMSAKCAINTALLDGAAKRARKPAHDFLGLKFREGHHVTSFTIGIDSPAAIRKKVLSAASYPVIKMKVGVPSDAANLRALREAAPTKPLRLDANEAWKTKEEALDRILFFASDGQVEFIEQPMPATTSVQDWIWLKRRSPLPIFADESYHRAADVARVAKCFHGVNVKLAKAGGITAAAEALRVARRAGLKTMVGCMIETSILISAAAHVAELCDYIDLDGNLLVTNDPYKGVTAQGGILSFAAARELAGLRVTDRADWHQRTSAAAAA